MTDGHQVDTQNTAHFLHDYSSDQADLRRLYEQAKIDQWNAATDIDWAVPRRAAVMTLTLDLLTAPRGCRSA